MLQSIREKATGPLAWGIVAIISVPFAFFGIEAFRSGGGTSYAAKVNGQEISRYELDNRVDARYAQFQQMLGDNFDPQMFSRTQLRGGVLEDLIREEVIRQYLADSGHRISFYPPRYRQIACRRYSGERLSPCTRNSGGVCHSCNID